MKQSTRESRFSSRNFVPLLFVLLWRWLGGLAGRECVSLTAPGRAREPDCGGITVSGGRLAVACGYFMCSLLSSVSAGMSCVPSLLATATDQQVLRCLYLPLSASSTRLVVSPAMCPDKTGTCVSSAVGVLPTSRGKHGILELCVHSLFFSTWALARTHTHTHTLECIFSSSPPPNNLLTWSLL